MSNMTVEQIILRFGQTFGKIAIIECCIVDYAMSIRSMTEDDKFTVMIRLHAVLWKWPWETEGAAAVAD